MTATTDLDFSALLPQIIVIKAKDKSYELNMDIRPTFLHRIQAWSQKSRANIEGADEEAVHLTAEALKIDIEEARGLGGIFQESVLGFLAGERVLLRKATT